MLLRSKNFFRNSLRSAAPPTPEQADSALGILLGFSSGRTQNPPVLWLTESVCSCPEQPLSATHGRQRYTTLDLAITPQSRLCGDPDSKVVCHETAGFFGFFRPRRVLPSIGCLPPRQRRRLWKPLPRERCPLWIPLPTGRSRPYWITQSQRNCHPFGIPARFEMSTHKWKMVCGHSFQNEIIPRASSDMEMKFWGFTI